MGLIDDEGWQVGDDAVVVALLTDPRTKKPIDPATIEVSVEGTKGDGSPFELTVGEPEEGLYEAPIFFDVAGDWRGHLIVTGDRRQKRSFRVSIGAG